MIVGGAVVQICKCKQDLNQTGLFFNFKRNWLNFAQIEAGSSSKYFFSNLIDPSCHSELSVLLAQIVTHLAQLCLDYFLKIFFVGTLRIFCHLRLEMTQHKLLLNRALLVNRNTIRVNLAKSYDFKTASALFVTLARFSLTIFSFARFALRTAFTKASIVSI